MSEVYINTSQNVQIKYSAAGVGYRLISNLIDFAVLFFYGIICLYIIGGFSEMGQSSGWIISLVFLPISLYHLLLEIFLNGQTIGMLLMKTKVVKLDGTPPDISAYFLRWLFRIIDVFTLSGLPSILCIAVSEKGQRWGDMAADTTVVRLTQRTALHDTILNVGQAKRELVFATVHLLSDKDVGITKDVYQLCSRNGNYTALAQLSAKLKERMNISSTMDDKTFVETVIADYNTYQFD
jgi:uncharacterized RDD family membrane protein YckC